MNIPRAFLDFSWLQSTFSREFETKINEKGNWLGIINKRMRKRMEGERMCQTERERERERE